jgi:hypothetical protein
MNKSITDIVNLVQREGKDCNHLLFISVTGDVKTIEILDFIHTLILN